MLLCRDLQSFQIILVERFICIVIVLMVPFAAQAQSQAAINAAMSTRSFRRADAALNTAYTRYMAGNNGYMTPASKKALKEAQRTWLKFRDAEALFVASGYEHTTTHTGGHWVEEYAAALAALTDERTKYLKQDTYEFSDANVDSNSEDDPDQGLNKAYKALLSVLYDRQKKLLTKAELAWIKFRDAEVNRFDGPKPKYVESAFNQLTVDRARTLKASYLRYKHLNSPN